MFVYDFIFIFMGVLILLVLLLHTTKLLPTFKITIALMLLTLLCYLGRNNLPSLLQLPINTFFISYHNANFTELKALGGTEKFTLEEHIAPSFYLEGFAGKKLFFDEEKDFYVLMEGIIVTPRSMTKTFHFNITWAKAYLIIDGQTIQTIDRTNSYDYTFSPGFHSVKIKVVNTNVTPTKMYVSMSEYEPILSDENITQSLKPYVQNDTNLYYAFGYKRKTLDVVASSAPTIAFLKSSEGGTTEWEINHCKEANLKAIVYNGVGDTIKTDCDNVLILRAKKLTQLTELPTLSQCNDFAPMGFACQNGPQKLKTLNKEIIRYTGMSLTGFSPSSKFNTIALPEIVLTKDKYLELEQIERNINEAKIVAEKRRVNPFYAFEQTRWSEIVKIDKEHIPLNKFRGYFMQSNMPTYVMHFEDTSSISVHYSDKKKFYLITPDHFLGLWVGDFTFDKQSTKHITLSISWAKAKVIVDGNVIFEGEHSTTLPYTFSKGKHRIEIEYTNNYGQVDFLCDIQDATQEIDASFKTLLTPQTKIYMVGLYGGWRNDHGLDLWLAQSNDPVVLFVASYHATHWNIKNTKNLKAVVYNSHNPGSSVKTDNPKVQIFHDATLRYASRLMPFCYEGPIVHCENKDAFAHSIAYIEKLTGRKPDGFSSIEEPSFSTANLKKLNNTKDITVPQIRLDTSVYEKINDAMKALK
ncbi:MAG: hypothetical protein PHN18_11655 [Sulfurospirillaceae bacterium]|nr:hypothetical protein [Sulfurospirillaceae bacterium]MDD2827590.1 hypothetical protein [Sulfurospirillaceae bacterium]